jgi:hypothetical protein
MAARMAATEGRFTLDAGITFDHSGQYSAIGPFDYKWP